MTDKIVLFTTCETEADAVRIARHLVETRLAACVNITGGISSIYRWNDAVESATEYMLLIKTSRGLFAEVRAAIEKLHPYQLPECIALPVVEGSDRYLSWIESGLKHAGSGPR